MFILDIRLDGNTILDADPNCKKRRILRFSCFDYQYLFDFFVIDRQHVLDCLPRLWMCDGIFISSKYC